MSSEEFKQWTMDGTPSKKHGLKCIRGDLCDGANCPVCRTKVKCENSFLYLALSGLNLEAKCREVGLM